MRAPPPVEFASPPGRAWRAATAVLAGVAVAAPFAALLPRFAAWDDGIPERSAWQLLAGSPQLGAVAVVAGLTAARALWRKTMRLGAHTLRWDGQDWVLPATDDHPERRGTVELMLDLGPWLLVRFRPHAPSTRRLSRGTWLPLSSTGDAARWSALRGALWNGRPGAPAPR